MFDTVEHEMSAYNGEFCINLDGSFAVILILSPTLLTFENAWVNQRRFYRDIGDRRHLWFGLGDNFSGHFSGRFLQFFAVYPLWVFSFSSQIKR